MKSRAHDLLAEFIVLALLSTLVAQLPTLHAQGTSLTCQGLLGNQLARWR